MATIHFVRHAESRHNVEPEGDRIPDPHLTPTGENQAKALSSKFTNNAQIQAIISSPMRRTIQTTLLGFGPAIKDDTRIVLHSDLQECSSKPSDSGSPVSELVAEFGTMLNTKLLSEYWYSEGASESYGARDQKKVAERARRARLYIRNVAKALSEQDHIIVVTHSGFLRHLIHGAPKFKNAEIRACQFVDVQGVDDQAVIVEILH
ncbi:histidine phosphatase superfamily [Xylaria arbuscula]|uniref:Uncharacterized protein n=1 Tax=Xylaria arbuscula TaxID=114810 RepID=A0A9W8NJU7_9PEZI|nr:histidine phosphatase superfamily [Xylaria arbuscula]KAJ3578159.1 hypothetical protein NPX13_g2406 [Xylaria arbuscula]